MKNQNTTTTATAAYIDYKACDIAAAVALRAKHQKSGLQFIADLQNQRAADRAALNLAAYAEEAATLERKRADLYQTADTLQAHADKLTTPAEEARAAASAAAEARRAAKKLTPRIDQLNALFSLTLSDRADIVQAAALEAITRAADPAEVTEEALTRATAQLKAWTAEAEEAAKDSRTAYAAHNAAASALVFLEALTPEEVAQDTANYKATITAAGRAISAHAAPEALNRYTTKATQATPEEVAQWVKMYGGTGADIKHHTPIKRTRASECWETMEFKKYKHKPSGFYHITHYRTIAPYVSYEAFTEQSGGDNAEVVKNSGINVIETQAAAEALETVIAAANLTERERLFCRYILDNTAARHGERAVTEYYADRAAKGQKPSKKAAESARWKRQRDNALDRIGLTNKEARKKFLQRIRKAFADPENNRRNAAKAADSVSKYPTTPEGWKALMCHRPTGEAAPERRRDMVEAWTTAESIIYIDQSGNQTERRKTNAAPVINWTESGTTPEAINPGTDYRAAAILAAEAITEANNAIERARRADVAAEIARIRAAQAAAREEHRRQYASREAVTVTAKQWNGWTAAQRLEHIKRTAAEGKRTEFK